MVKISLGEMSDDSEDDSKWGIFGGRVPPPSPSKRAVLQMPATELISRRLQFWSNLPDEEEESDTESADVSLPELLSEPLAELLSQSSEPCSQEEAQVRELLLHPITESCIRSTHPGSPEPCLSERDSSFDPVLFVLERCRTDSELGSRFAGMDRKQFLSLLHLNFVVERERGWTAAERAALAPHLLLLSALADDEALANACARQLRADPPSRWRLQDLLLPFLAWGAPVGLLREACTEGIFIQDCQSLGLTPSRPPPFCVRAALRALPPTLANAALPGSALANAALVVRALALCALDAEPALACEFIAPMAAALASAAPGWTEHSVAVMSAALHLPSAHAHAQAWVAQRLLPRQRAHPVRSRLALTQLAALLARQPLMAGLDNHHRPMGMDDAIHEPMGMDDAIHDPMGMDDAIHEPMGMDVGVAPPRGQSQEVLQARPLAELLRLLTNDVQRVFEMAAYRKYVLLLLVAACVDQSQLCSLDDAATLRQLIGWLSELSMSQPNATGKLDSVLIQGLVAGLLSVWQRALERFTEEILQSSQT